MARIAGVDIPREKRLEISLTYIFGIGPTLSTQICEATDVNPVHPGAGPHRRRGRPAPHLHRRQLQGRGRPAPRRLPGHQAQDGDQLLPGRPPPQGPAGPRPAHAHQRPHPQGPEEDRGREEEGEASRWPSPPSTAPGGPAARSARTSPTAWRTSRARSTTPSSRSPTPRATCSPGPRPATSASRARASPPPSPPSWPPRPCAKRAMEHGVRKVDVLVRGPGSGRETAIRSLAAAGIEVVGIKDVTPIPHNGCRPKKRRRV